MVQVAKKYIGKSVDIDGVYGAQCVDYSNRVAMDIDGTRFAYVWTKTNFDGTVDTAWNLAHQTSQKSITITNSDVRQRATFDCTAESLN